MYFKKGVIPIVLSEGTKPSRLSRGVNSAKAKDGEKPASTVAAAFMPGVSENTSMVSPTRTPTASVRSETLRN